MTNALGSYVNEGRSAGEIKDYLEAHGCFEFPQLPCGLFSAIRTDADTDQTGYADAWLRDSSCIALALWRSGRREQATLAAEGVLTALAESKEQFTAGSRDKRPAVRFHGLDAKPVGDWPNAQNDALGYALFFLGELSAAGALHLSDAQNDLIKSVVSYLGAIEYWHDEDSGHWEEVPKCNASSIGAVVAGLEAVRPLIDDDELIEKGRLALTELLPHESVTPGQERDADAATLFLVEPLGVLDAATAERVVQTIQQNLEGNIGVKRYVGDSYWAPDYREHFKMGDRAADFTHRMAERDAFLRPGMEAQWSLFDPLLAVYFAKQGDRETAWRYLKRSLVQLVEDGGKLKLPEAYFSEHDTWVPNDHIGLLWAEANLLYALTVLDEKIE